MLITFGILFFQMQKNIWHHICITQYHKEFYISHVTGELCTLKVIPNKSVEAVEGFSDHYDDGRDDLEKSWGKIIESAAKWLKTVKKDWVSANKKFSSTIHLSIVKVLFQIHSSESVSMMFIGSINCLENRIV